MKRYEKVCEVLIDCTAKAAGDESSRCLGNSSSLAMDVTPTTSDIPSSVMISAKSIAILTSNQNTYILISTVTVAVRVTVTVTVTETVTITLALTRTHTP